MGIIMRNGVAYGGGGGDDSTFIGTTAQWEALTTSEKAQYNIVDFTDDYSPSSGFCPLVIIYTTTGSTVTLSKTGVSVTAEEVETGKFAATMPDWGTYTITATLDSKETTDTVTINTVAIYEISLSSTPEGATVTPTDDIQTWLACVEIEKNYTTLAEVLADQETYESLLANSNACDYMARSTTWALAEGAVPTMTSDTTPSGVASVGTTTAYSGFEAYKAFDNDINTCWLTADNPSLNDVWIKYDFGTPKTITKAKLGVTTLGSNYQFHIKGFVISGSNDDSTYTDLLTGTTTSNASGNTEYFDFTTVGNYRYYKLKATSNWYSSGLAYSLGELQFYEADITTSETAMRLLGKYDYACNKLLSNATWAEAIASSNYWDSIFDVCVPKMTSNTAPKGTVLFSSQYSSASYPAYYAFDRTANKFVANGVANQYIGYDFTSSVKVDFVYITNETAMSTQGIQNCKLQYSDDNSTWTDVPNGSIVVPQGGSAYIISSISATHRYWRVYFLNNYGGSYISVQELQFYGHTPLQNSYTPLVPTMTSNTTPSGEVLFDSGQTSSGTGSTNYYYLFNNVLSDTYIVGVSTSTSWQYFGYDFGNPIIVDRVGIYGYYSSGTISIKVQGYNGTEWVDVYDIGTYTSSKAYQYFEFNNSTAYSKYRFYCTKGTASSIAFTELQFYAKLDKTIIHSAPMDTIYYMDNGSPSVLCTTNSEGLGEFDMDILNTGTYTLYSSVAKDPSNLSNDYGKAIFLEKSEYGETKEIYLMPSNALYWYGWTVGTITNPCPAQATTHTAYQGSINTNNISVTKFGAATQRGVAINNVNATGMTKLKAITNDNLRSVDISDLSSNLYCGIYDITHNAGDTTWWNRVGLLSNLSTPLTIVANYVEQNVNATFIVNAVWLE